MKGLPWWAPSIWCMGREQMCHLYPNLGLGCYAEDDETKLEMAVHQAMKDGNQAIVGGYSTVQIAERLGMPAAMIHSGIEAVNHAISEAIAVAISPGMRGRKGMR